MASVCGRASGGGAVAAAALQGKRPAAGRAAAGRSATATTTATATARRSVLGGAARPWRGRGRALGGVRVRSAPSVGKTEEGSGSSENGQEGAGRSASVERETKETSVYVKINIDGTGKCDCDSGVPFLDHMLDQIASHGLFDVEVKAKGDTWIDDHHTTEDIALAFGQCLSLALGTRAGIFRARHMAANSTAC